jgi:protocatechuate 3,4-dioxygenase beta subunit
MQVKTHFRCVGILVVALSTAPAAVAERGGCEDAKPSRAVLEIAGPDEPGERLILTGKVLEPDGSPASGVLLRIYHTDAEGYYSRNGRDEDEARLCGIVATAADGGYEVRTTRAGRYPTGGPPPHVHLEALLPAGGEKLFTVFWKKVEVGIDPEAGDRRASTRPLVLGEDGVLRLVYDLVLPP